MRLFPFLSVLVILLISSCTEQIQGIKPQYRDVTEAVYSTITVQPRHSYKVYPQVGGIIEELSIEEGDEVKKGDFLFKITNNKSNVNIQNAKLNYEIAKESFNGESAMMKEMAEQIEISNVRVRNDSMNYERQKRLWQQNIGSRIEFENRKLAYDISKNELDRLKTTFTRTQKELKTQVAIAKNTLKISQLNNDDLKILSKLDGMVFSIEKEEGESVSSQTVVAIIGSKSDFILSLLIDEVDISKIYEGQTVVVLLDAYPTLTYEAKVVKIYPEKDERSLTFAIEAEFVTKPDRLLKGLSGEANIIISEKKNVLTIPSQFITRDNKVNTKSGWKSVETGLKSLEFTEILSGIDSSTLIKIFE
jgi:HlyD family secretion protein